MPRCSCSVGSGQRLRSNLLNLQCELTGSLPLQRHLHQCTAIWVSLRQVRPNSNFAHRSLLGDLRRLLFNFCEQHQSFYYCPILLVDRYLRTKFDRVSTVYRMRRLAVQSEMRGRRFFNLCFDFFKPNFLNPL